MKKVWNKFILITLSFFLLIIPYTKIEAFQSISLQPGKSIFAVGEDLLVMLYKKSFFSYWKKEKIKKIEAKYKAQELIGEDKEIEDEARKQLKKEGFSNLAQTIVIKGSKNFSLKKKKGYAVTLIVGKKLKILSKAIEEPAMILFNLEETKDLSYFDKQRLMLHEVAHVVMAKKQKFSEELDKPIEETVADLYFTFSMCQKYKSPFKFWLDKMPLLKSEENEEGYLTIEEWSKHRKKYLKLIAKGKALEGKEKWKLLKKDAEAILRERKKTCF